MPNLRVPNPTYIAKYVPNPPRISLKQWNYVELPLDHGIISSSSNNKLSMDYSPLDHGITN